MSKSLVAVGGPSGSGKTALIDRLIARYPQLYARPISYTSRKQRLNEGSSEYSFVSRDTILSMSSTGMLLNLDNVYGELYGMAKSSFASAASDSLILVKEIHPAHHDALTPSVDCLVKVLLIGDYDSRPLASSTDNTRHQSDQAYYALVDRAAFDIVMKSWQTDALDDIADWFHVAIQSTIETRALAVADLADSIIKGYDDIFDEFSDINRITTRNFHTLSRGFMQGAIHALVREGNAVLEVGPGSGWLRSTFLWPEVNYTAIDISLSMLRHWDHGARRVVASAERLPFRNLSYDFVFASLMDAFCYPLALCELRRVLSRSGHLIITSPSSVWSDRIRPHERKRLTTFRRRNGREVSVPSFTYSHQEFVDFLSRCGFEIVVSESLTSGFLQGERQLSAAILSCVSKLSDDLPILNACIAKPSLPWEPTI